MVITLSKNRMLLTVKSVPVLTIQTRAVAGVPDRSVISGHGDPEDDVPVSLARAPASSRGIAGGRIRVEVLDIVVIASLVPTSL